MCRIKISKYFISDKYFFSHKNKLFLVKEEDNIVVEGIEKIRGRSDGEVKKLW